GGEAETRAAGPTQRREAPDQVGRSGRDREERRAPAGQNAPPGKRDRQAVDLRPAAGQSCPWLGGACTTPFFSAAREDPRRVAPVGGGHLRRASGPPGPPPTEGRPPRARRRAPAERPPARGG